MNVSFVIILLQTISIGITLAVAYSLYTSLAEISKKLEQASVELLINTRETRNAKKRVDDLFSPEGAANTVSAPDDEINMDRAEYMQVPKDVKLDIEGGDSGIPYAFANETE